MRFYRHKETGELVKAHSSDDSKVVHTYAEGGEYKAHSVADFSRDFELVRFHKHKETGAIAVGLPKHGVPENHEPLHPEPRDFSDLREAAKPDPKFEAVKPVAKPEAKPEAKPDERRGLWQF